MDTVILKRPASNSFQQQSAEIGRVVYNQGIVTDWVGRGMTILIDVAGRGFVQL